MRMKTFYAAALAVASTIAVASAASVPWTVAKAKVGEAAPAFALTDTDGNAVNLSDFKGKTVVLEWFCPQCPWSGRQSGKSVHSTGQVNDLIKGIKAADENAVYLLIDSSGGLMSKDKLAKTDAGLRTRYKLSAPILIDWDGTVGRNYGAKTTPHMYVIDGEGVLRYAGAFSDKRKTNYVLGAVKQIAAGEKVTPSEVKSWGCGVKYN